MTEILRKIKKHKKLQKQAFFERYTVENSENLVKIA
jgi:hypothetical protein